MSQDSQVVNLFDSQEVCTHNVPNKVQLVNTQHQFRFEHFDTYKINLTQHYKAEAVFCKNGSTCST